MEEDASMGPSAAAAAAAATKSVDPEAARRKHAAMLERLSNRVHKPSSASAAVAAPGFESVQTFLDRFSASRRSIEGDIERCRLRHQQSQGQPGSEMKQDLDAASAAIAALEKLAAENSYFLPSYEVRTALKSVADLKESLDRASAEMLPRKRFAFRSRPLGKKDSIGAMAKKVEDVKVSEEGTRALSAVDGDQPKFAVQDSPGFRNLEGAVQVKDFRIPEERLRGGQGDFSLCDLDSCQVYLRGQCRALFIHRMKNCRVYAGPVLGSVHIEEVENCVLVLASHQIRIHQAKATDFYLRVRSRPIIEDSSGVRFAPYILDYKGLEDDLRDSSLWEENGKWGSVDDFKWLRAIQSPNWCILPENERLCSVDISELVGSGG